MKILKPILIVVVIIIGLLVIYNMVKRDKSELIERVTQLNIQNDSLLNNIKLLTSIDSIKDIRINELKDSILLEQSISETLESDYSDLESEYEDIANSLTDVPFDSSYQFLIHTAYPLDGELTFRFNAPQVRSIHLTYLERLMLIKKEELLLSRVDNYQSQLLLNDALYSEKDQQYSSVKQSLSDAQFVIKNKNEEIDLKDEEINRKDNRNLVWKITAIVVTAIAIIK